MNDPIGVGIVGINPDRGWAKTAHIPALAALPGFALRAVATSRRESAVLAGEAFGVPGFSDIRAMLDRKDIDLVVVTVRAPCHREIVLAAIAAGKAVLCEWPLGKNLDETIELASAAAQAGVPNFIGLQARSSPTLNYLRTLVAEGYVGQLLSTTLIGSGNYWGPVVSREDAYIVDRDGGASMLMIPFGHSVDALCHCLGEFTDLSATTATQRKQITETDSNTQIPMTVEDQVLAHGTLAGGAKVAAHYRGGSSRGTNLLWEINGTHGDLVVTGQSGSLQLSTIHLKGACGEDRKLADLPVPDAYRWVENEALAGPALNVAQNYVSIAHSLRGEEPPLRAPTFEDALYRHRMLATIQAAAADGRRHRLAGPGADQAIFPNYQEDER